MENWYFVEIAHARLLNAIDVTFRHMLISEYRTLGQPADCRVYRGLGLSRSYLYFFTPEAADHLRALVNFWEGVGCSEPTNLAKMEVII